MPWPTWSPPSTIWAIFSCGKRRRRPWLPASHNILRAFTIPFDSIKVLIVGQDPYPTPGHPVGFEHSAWRQMFTRCRKA